MAPHTLSGSPRRAVARDGNWLTNGGRMIGSVTSATTTTSRAGHSATGRSARATAGLARNVGITTTNGESSATETSVVRLGLGVSVRKHIGWMVDEDVQRPESM
jgi:hypothetical protein